MKKYKKIIIVLTLLTLMIIIILIVNRFSNNIVSASYSNGEIDLKLNESNSENIETINLSYTLFFLDNYKNVTPFETSLVLSDLSSEYTFKIDSDWFLGMKDLIEFTLDITYKNGNHKEYITTYTDFLEDFSKDLCIEPEIINNYYVYKFNSVYAKISSIELPDNFVFFKSSSNPDEIFYVGFKYDSYLYPIKKYQIISKSDYVNTSVDEKPETVITFANESGNENIVLLYKEYIEHPWPGLFPFDENGELIEFINNNPVGLSLINNNEVSEVYQNSMNKYSEYLQSIPTIEFYYEQ